MAAISTTTALNKATVAGRGRVLHFFERFQAMKQLTVLAALIGIAGSTLLAGGNGSGKGTYLEARTAEVFVGGCVMNAEAGTSGRQAVLAWKVVKGTFNGVSIDNLAVVAAINGNQNLSITEIGGGRATTKSAVYVDQRATQVQQIALVAMANELSRGLVGTVVKVTPTAIQFADTKDAVSVRAGDAVLDVTKKIDHDASCGAMQWFHPLSSMSNSTLGTADQHSFMGTALGTKWSDPHKKSAFFGSFSY
jgi:hypothetical protein